MTLLVSVVMTAYNAEKFIAPAITSILEQQFRDFEFIIVNDGSSDQTKGIIQLFASKDKRIRFIDNPQNLGMVKARNIGFKQVSSAYVAIMDADDQALPERLQKQVQYLEQHPDIAVVGSNVWIINEEGQQIGRRKYPQSIEAVKSAVLKYNPFAHPAVMFRSELLRSVGVYDENLRVADDYDYWLRVLKSYQGINLNDYLLEYRISQTQSKRYALKELLQNTITLQNQAIRKLGYHFTLSDWLHYYGLQCLQILPNNWIATLFQSTRYSK